MNCTICVTACQNPQSTGESVQLSFFFFFFLSFLSKLLITEEGKLPDLRGFNYLPTVLEPLLVGLKSLRFNLDPGEKHTEG